ncbi:MAG TPA: 4'-phosphopantetheinyl transferase superfamily protein [Anaerolineae bacterium]|nr:4'-phosphopantetheinyl transferase superfamily protein [Anaerolineae bacterium]
MWANGQGDFTLSAEQIHVWSADLRATEAQVARLRQLLSADERARADRYRFPRHKRRYTVARGVLRQLLGQYLGVAPVDIVFHTTKYGKPYVKAQVSGQVLQFNVSHSYELALFALNLGRRIGIDVEHRRRVIDLESVANHFFSAAEIETLLAAPTHAKQQLFLNCWTRKEAYIKGLGEGLSHPLDTFEVSMKVGAPVCLLADYTDPTAPQRWQFYLLTPNMEYVAALAVEAKADERLQTVGAWQLSCWRWQ